MLKCNTFLFTAYLLLIALNSDLIAQDRKLDDGRSFHSDYYYPHIVKNRPDIKNNNSGLSKLTPYSDDILKNPFMHRDQNTMGLSLNEKNSGIRNFSRTTEILVGEVKEEWVQNYASRLESSADYVGAAVIDAVGNVYITGLFGVWGRSSFYPEGFRTVKIKPDGTEEWVAIYTSDIPSSPGDIAVDGFGNVYVTGVSVHDSINHYYWDYTTVKYNSSGIEQWVAFYDGTGNGDDVPYAITVDESANIYVTGYSWGGASEDYATIKYNSNGVQQWVARYDGPGNLGDAGRDIVLDKSGYCYVTGISYGLGTMFDCATVKYDENGVEQWVVRYNNPDGIGDAAYNIAIDDSSNIYIAGRSNGALTSDDYITIKYDTNGIEQWAARYNGPDNDLDGATDLEVDVYGNVFVTGWSFSFTTEYDYSTVKYNSFGVEQWVARYNGIGNTTDIPYAIALDNSGNVIVTGSCNYPEDFATLKYNSAGEEQWVALYNGPANSVDGAVSISVDAFENIYVTGSSIGVNSDYDFATVKYNPSGIEHLVVRSDGPKVSLAGATDLAIDSSGNVYVTGSCKDLGAYNFDIVTVKYNSIGDEQWVIRYAGSENLMDYPTGIAVDAWGNVFVTGLSWRSGTASDYITIKYDGNGNEQWIAFYNGPGNSQDGAVAIALDDSGNVYVTGTCWGNASQQDYATIKYNIDGTQQWVALYNGPGGHSSATALVLDAFGNVYVTGDINLSAMNSDYATLKYNNSGSEQWVAFYDGPTNSSDLTTAIAVDVEGNVYVTGYSWGGSNTYEDYATIKYNSSGEQQWVARYNGSGNLSDIPVAIAVDAARNVYVTGYVSVSNTNRDYATIKYNSSGVQQWSRQYDGPGNSDDEAAALVLDSFGNPYVTGFSYSGTSWESSDIATIKYNTVGEEQWIIRYNGAGISMDAAHDLAVDASGNIYVTGSSGGTFYYRGVFTTIKYSQLPTTIEDIILSIPETFVLAQNYPNPFNPSTTIRWQSPVSSWQTLKIYDVLGNEIATLVDEYKPAGSYEVEFNGNSDEGQNLSSGVYFYRLQAGEFSDTKKLILMK